MALRTIKYAEALARGAVSVLTSERGFYEKIKRKRTERKRNDWVELLNKSKGTKRSKKTGLKFYYFSF
jgi:hypothetical protein